MNSMALPSPSGGFSWTGTPCGPILKCGPLADAAEHLFSTRRLVLRGETAEQGWACLAGALGVAPARLVRLRQVHGTSCVTVASRDASSSSDPRPEADALMTTDPAIALAIQVADCVPVLMADRRGRVVCAVHAGWRGTASAIVQLIVQRFRSEHGVHPVDLIVAVGPSIGPCCYEVGDEVRDRFRAQFGAAADSWFGLSSNRPSRPHLDLWKATSDQLVAAGVPAEQVHVAALCTASHLDIFHSYRAEGQGTGRMAGVIRRR